MNVRVILRADLEVARGEGITGLEVEPWLKFIIIHKPQKKVCSMCSEGLVS